MTFTWVPVYKEIAKKLSNLENKQAELLEFIESIHSKGLITISLDDKDKNGKTIKLTEIDPFTFFANFNRGTTEENRIEIIRELKKRWDLKSDIPSDFQGIPIMNNQKSWFFSYKAERKSEDIPLLWKLFKEAVNNDFISETSFNNVLEIKGIKVNITMGLYWIKPEIYLPLDKNTRSFLELDFKDLDFNVYKQILDSAKKHNKTMYELSYDAWFNNDRNYWIFQGNPKIFKMEDYIKENDIITWTASNNFKQMKTGDLVLFWMAGPESKVVAQGFISKAPDESIKDKPEDSKYWNEGRVEKEQLKCELQITDRYGNELTRTAIKEILPELPI